MLANGSIGTTPLSAGDVTTGSPGFLLEWLVENDGTTPWSGVYSLDVASGWNYECDSPGELAGGSSGYLTCTVVMPTDVTPGSQPAIGAIVTAGDLSLLEIISIRVASVESASISWSEKSPTILVAGQSNQVEVEIQNTGNAPFEHRVRILAPEDWDVELIDSPIISLNQQAYESLKGKNQKLEKISNRLAKYLSPQIYKNIFETESEQTNDYKRKKLTVFFSDIKGFTDLSDSLDPDLLAELVNEYLSAMTEIALKHGGTIDKFIGDAILIFFGDPESDGLKKDASKCLSMAIAMQKKVAELDKNWREVRGITEGLKVRIGISTGYCTVGNFGSVQRVDYTVLGSTVNLASRLESICQPKKILVAPETKSLLEKEFKFEAQEAFELKGFNKPVIPFQYVDLKKTTSSEILEGDVVDIILKQPDDIESILYELKSLQKDYEEKLFQTVSHKKNKK